jgi:hypothetical protein
MKTNQDRAQIRTAAKLNRAIDHIDAVQISPRKWVYLAHEAGEYFTVSKAELIVLGTMLLSHDEDAYSEWCAGWGRLATTAELRQWREEAHAMHARAEEAYRSAPNETSRALLDSAKALAQNLDGR